MRTLRWIVVVFALCLMAGFIAFFVTTPSGPGSVQRIDHPSPAMLQAIDSAKKGLPQFLKELKHPKDGQRFAVMARFSTSAGNEYLWLKNPEQRGSRLAATLDQKPMVATMIRGDHVEFPTSDVVDWMIRDPDGTTRGNFTEKSQ